MSSKERQSGVGQGFELWHTAGFDVVLNLTYSNIDEARRLMKVLENGVPENWDEFLPYDIEWLMGEYGYVPQSYRRFYVDQLKEPQYLVKRKRGPGRNLRHKPFQSVISEVVMAPLIRGVVASEAVQALAVERGFAGMRYVEPMGAMIERARLNKYLVYPFINGDTTLYTRGKDGNTLVLIEDEEEFLKRLGRVFSDYGIRLYDWGMHQMMASNVHDPEPLMLYLVDAEGYCGVKEAGS